MVTCLQKLISQTTVTEKVEVKKAKMQLLVYANRKVPLKNDFQSLHMIYLNQLLVTLSQETREHGQLANHYL